MRYHIKNKSKGYLTVLLLVSLLSGLISFHNVNVAYAAWAELDGGTTSSETVDVGKNTITITGKHNAADDDVIRYKTCGYYMTLKKYDLDNTFSRDSNSFDKEYVPMQIIKEVEKAGVKTTTYSIQRTDFLEAAQKLIKQSGASPTDGSNVTVYLNNIFNIVKGSNDAIYKDKSNIYGYQEMLDQAGWSSTTEKYLKGYYNLPFSLSNIFYKVKINAVDEDLNLLDGSVNSKGKTINNPLSSMDVMYKDTVSYSVSDSDQTLTLNNIKYSYKNWFYKYTPYGEDSKTKSDSKAGDVSFKAPDADENSTLTVYLVYEKNAPPKPSVTSKPNPTATPTQSPDPTVAPEPDEASAFTTAFTTGLIRADNRGNEKFTATAGIPTTESLYGQVTAKEYLLGYRFIKKTGTVSYSIKVTRNYILNWTSATPDGKGVKQPQTETVPVTQYISITRAYGYWEIENFDYYNISHAMLYNYSFPNGNLILKPNNSYYHPPSITCYHDADSSYHLIPPDEAVNGILLPSQTLSGGTSKPSIPSEDFTNYAQSQTGKIKVRNDSVTFDGNTVMSGSIVTKEGNHPNTNALPQCSTYTNQNALYDDNQIINATKLNGEYSSSGTIAYQSIIGIGSLNPDLMAFPISGLNDVVIHTPVICDPIITAGNDKYVQLVSSQKEATELVLDPDQSLSDFSINISNTGFHTGIAGFFTRDFSKSLHDNVASYILEEKGLLCNEVKFPFDVFIDRENDKKTTNDDYIKADTWIILGRSTQCFYLPTWIREGVYTVDFRTIAVNGGNHLSSTENYANRDIRNYVATNTAKFEISGRIYGLTLYDISDYPMWEEAFRIPDSSVLKKNSGLYSDGTGKDSYNKNYSYTYTVGTNDQYGNDTGRKIKYTFPLVNGSHPQYKNQGILKTGYLIRFSIDTIGDMYSDDAGVILKPSFYFVDKNGKNRKAVDLYYTENIGGKTRNLVKVGGNMDKTNIKYFHTGDLNLAIPESEMKLTAALSNMKYGNYFWQKSAMFIFAKIQLNYAFRTFIGQDYTKSIKKLDSFDTIRTRVSENDVTKTIQRWYGQYYLPNDIHVVEKGYDVMDYAAKHGIRYNEDFWLEDGYIIINMNIYTLEDGKEHLSYVNANNYEKNGNCSMWIMEGPPLSKDSNKGPVFNFYAGDFFIYYTNKKMSDDYSTGAIY